MNRYNVLLEKNQKHYFLVVKIKQKFKDKHIFANAYSWNAVFYILQFSCQIFLFFIFQIIVNFYSFQKIAL